MPGECHLTYMSGMRLPALHLAGPGVCLSTLSVLMKSRGEAPADCMERKVQAECARWQKKISAPETFSV
jgi:hypothetical protein